MRHATVLDDIQFHYDDLVEAEADDQLRRLRGHDDFVLGCQRIDLLADEGDGGRMQSLLGLASINAIAGQHLGRHLINRRHQGEELAETAICT